MNDTAFTRIARMSGILASLIGLVGAVVLLMVGQPILAGVFAVFAIAGVGTIAFAPRRGR
jgi:uncharacterized protein with ACT and thioredoxin-like domain